MSKLSTTILIFSDNLVPTLDQIKHKKPNATQVDFAFVNDSENTNQYLDQFSKNSIGDTELELFRLLVTESLRSLPTHTQVPI